MFGAALSLLLLILLFGIGRMLVKPSDDSRIVPLLVGAYVLRLGLSFVVTDLPIFSYGSGGDASYYEMHAQTIANLWRHDEIFYVTMDELPDLGRTTLPSNIFALIIYLNGERTHLGCAAFVAFVSVLACLLLYRLAVELHSDPKVAFTLFAYFLVMPSYLFLTSDTYKDGMVVFLVFAALLAAFRLTRQFSMRDAALGMLAIFGLWHVRFYLIFIVTVPLVVGLLGPRARNPVRAVAVMAGICGLVALIASSTSAFTELANTAETTFEFATLDSTVASNANEGSGMLIEGGGLGSFLVKLFLMLFAPLPWQGGSIGLHFGKVETVIWYFLFYHTVRGAKLMWRSSPIELAALLSFLLPCTFIYATTFANVGLSLRLRFVIVMLSTIVAARSLSLRKRTSPERSATSRAGPVLGEQRS